MTQAFRLPETLINTFRDVDFSNAIFNNDPDTVNLCPPWRATEKLPDLVTLEEDLVTGLPAMVTDLKLQVRHALGLALFGKVTSIIKMGEAALLERDPGSAPDFGELSEL